MRLADSLARLADGGTPLMRGAAAAVRVLLGHTPATVLGARAASWVDTATDPGTRAELTARLTGLLTAAGSLLETAPEALAPLLDRVGELPDSPFLERLPALRGGFDTLSPAARDRLLTVIEERIDGTLDADLPRTRTRGPWPRGPPRISPPARPWPRSASCPRRRTRTTALTPYPHPLPPP